MEQDDRFRELFETTYPVVARYARHRGFAGQDLDDLVAATYEVAWRRFDHVPDGQAAVPWLLTVALNHARNHRRKLKRDRRLLEQLAAPEHATLGPQDGAYDWREIRRVLDRLPTADRELILLVAWDDLSPADAAAVMGLTPGAARTRLHRARTRLSDLLGRHEGGRAATDALIRAQAIRRDGR